MAEAKKNILTPDGLKALEDELQELKVVRVKRSHRRSKKQENRVTYQRTRNMMQPKMNSVIWKHVSKRSKRS